MNVVFPLYRTRYLENEVSELKIGEQYYRRRKRSVGDACYEYGSSETVAVSVWMGIIREGEQEVVHTFLDNRQFQKAIMQSFGQQFGYYADIHDDRADPRAEKGRHALQ